MAYIFCSVEVEYYLSYYFDPLDKDVIYFWGFMVMFSLYEPSSGKIIVWIHMLLLGRCFCAFNSFRVFSYKVGCTRISGFCSLIGLGTLCLLIGLMRPLLFGFIFKAVPGVYYFIFLCFSVFCISLNCSFVFLLWVSCYTYTSLQL